MLPRDIHYQIPDIDRLPDGRAPWDLDSDRALLLIHDMQHYFLDAFAPGQEPLVTLLRNMREVIGHARERGIPVMYTAHPANQGSQRRGLLADLWGPGIGSAEAARIHPEVAPGPRDVVLDKCRYDAFESTGLAERMRALGRDQLVITGIYAHIGCLATAIRAFVLDIQPFLVVDAVADLDPRSHEEAVRYVADCCGVPITSRRLAGVLARTAAVRGADPEGDGGADCGERGESEDAGSSTSPASQERSLPLTVRQVLDELSLITSTPVEQIALNSNPPDIGLDSVRMMMLAETWSDQDEEIDFMSMLLCESVEDLISLLERTRGISVARAGDQ